MQKKWYPTQRSIKATWFGRRFSFRRSCRRWCRCGRRCRCWPGTLPRGLRWGARWDLTWFFCWNARRATVAASVSSYARKRKTLRRTCGANKKKGSAGVAACGAEESKARAHDYRAACPVGRGDHPGLSGNVYRLSCGQAAQYHYRSPPSRDHLRRRRLHAHRRARAGARRVRIPQPRFPGVYAGLRYQLHR